MRGFFIAFIFLTVTVYLKFILSGKTATGANKFLKYNVLFIAVTLIGVFILRLPNLVLKEQNPDESQWIANAATFLPSGFKGGGVIGVDAVFGVEYTFDEIPLNICIDIMPNLNLVGYVGPNFFVSGISARYVF